MTLNMMSSQILPNSFLVHVVLYIIVRLYAIIYSGFNYEAVF